MKSATWPLTPLCEVLAEVKRVAKPDARKIVVSAFECSGSVNLTVWDRTGRRDEYLAAAGRTCDYRQATQYRNELCERLSEGFAQVMTGGNIR